jgi:hypothetical protein
MRNPGIKRTASITAFMAINLCLGILLRADELQFPALPQTVQATVIREGRIPNASSVTRIVRSSDGIYAVTVRRDTEEQIIYVNEAGAIVQAPATTTTTIQKTTESAGPATTTVQKTTESVQPETGAQETVVTYEEVQQSASRYELLEKKGKKEVYLDRQTGKKVTVKRDKD